MKCLVSCVTYEPASNQNLNRKFQHFWQKTRHRQQSTLTKVSANNTVPRGIVLFVKLLLDECSYVFLHVVLLQRLQRVITSHQLVDLDVAPGHCSSNISVQDYDIRSNKILHRSNFLSQSFSARFHQKRYLCCTVNGVLLHILGHVSILDHGFSFRHDACAFC